MRNKAYCTLLVMVCLCATALGQAPDIAEHAEELGPFAGGFADAVWTIIAFVVLLIVLWKLAWKPVLTGLRTREEHIQKQLADAEKTRTEAKEILAEYEAKLADAENQGKQIITNYEKKAEEQSKQIAADAREKIELLRKKAEADVQRARADAQAEMWAQAGEIVFKLGKDVLGKTMNAEDNQKLMDEAITKLRAEEN